MGADLRGIPTGLLTGAADRKLLDSLGLRLILDLRSESEAAEQPDYVTVELNGEFVDHSGFETTFVKDGDKVEFLYFMGGGAR